MASGTILKELNNKNKYNLRELHNIYGFDFNGFIYAARINGRFTIKHILEKVKKEYSNPSTCRIVIILNGVCRNGYSVVTLTSDGNIDKNATMPFVFRNIFHYSSKMQFENDRKDANAKGYIIAQENSKLKYKNNFSVDFTERFILKEANKFSRGKKIYSLDLVQMGQDGKGGTYYPAGYKYNSAGEIIDKSGYFRRVNLKGQKDLIRTFILNKY